MENLDPKDETVQLLQRAFAAGCTQHVLAHELGITARTLRRWREGEAVPRLDAYRKLVSFVALMEKRQAMIKQVDQRLGIAAENA